MSNKSIRNSGGPTEIEAFIEKVKSLPERNGSGSNGRLIFAMDATASRQPSWDLACHLQSKMFEAVVTQGALSVQLCFYRGYKECKNSRWMQEAADLQRAMSKVRCMGGQTQISRVLKHALQEVEMAAIDGLVFVGDCMEENVDELCYLAGKLRIKGVPIFLFQEGYDEVAGNAFREIARISKGAYCRFDERSAQQLADLMKAVAIYATGGRQAALVYSENKPFLAHFAGQLEAK